MWILAALTRPLAEPKPRFSTKTVYSIADRQPARIKISALKNVIEIQTLKGEALRRATR
ncbi:MAG: hypothetical protein OXD32_01040 [Endozoicomonadaceae bacterium]|nr:hypothetical protein [Endozoicomonadaceae bacterium]MCY4330636.1 hypothetical protein [Endozoicomonadaceae bacterium]